MTQKYEQQREATLVRHEILYAVQPQAWGGGASQRTHGAREMRVVGGWGREVSERM